MGEPRPVPHGTRDPIVVALGLALREIAERRAAEKSERRRSMVVVQGGKQGRGSA